MGTFAFLARDRSGRKQRGTISAATGRHAREQLREKGMRVEYIKERSEKTISNVRSTRFRTQLTSAIRELSTLLQAGVPMLDALDSIITQSKRGFRDAMLSVRDKVASGESLAGAMEGEPRVFDQMTVGMIRVGEHAGNLDEVCEQVAEFRERSGELKDRVLSAVLYPLIVLVVSIGVTIFLMTVVVPMLLQNLEEIGQPMPLPTKILKWLSDTLLGYGPLIFLGLAGVAALAIICLRQPRGREFAEKTTLATPILGTLIQKQALSRMALVVSSLLRSGVELVDALEIAERSTTNGLLKQALSEMQSDLRSGQDLREVTDKQKIFTHSMAQVFALGQQSGQLDKMLLRIGNDYDRQAGLSANRLTTIAEPVLILLLSIIVGFILFATVLPILEAGSVLDV